MKATQPLRLPGQSTTYRAPTSRTFECFACPEPYHVFGRLAKAVIRDVPLSNMKDTGAYLSTFGGVPIPRGDRDV